MKSRIVLFILCLSLCIGCKTIKPDENLSETKTTSTEGQKDTTTDSHWQDSLQSQRVEMKSTWLKETNPTKDFSGSYYKKMDYMSVKNIDSLKLLPIEVYTIKRSALESWSPEAPIENLMTLDKTRAYGYISEGETFVFGIDFKRLDNQWNYSEYGPIFASYSKTLSKIHFKDRKELFKIKIQIANNYYSSITIFKDSNNEYYTIGSGGITENFRTTLLAIKTNLNSGTM